MMTHKYQSIENHAIRTFRNFFSNNLLWDRIRSSMIICARGILRNYEYKRYQEPLSHLHTMKMLQISKKKLDTGSVEHILVTILLTKFDM